MAKKIRVYELAKELGLESKALLDTLNDMGVEAKNHMSALEEDVVAKLTAKVKPKGPAASKVKKEVRPAPLEEAASPQTSEKKEKAEKNTQPVPEARPAAPPRPPGPGGPRPQGGPGAPVRPGMPGRPGMAPGGAPMRPGMPPRPAGPGGPRPMGPGGPRPMGPGQRPGGPMGQGPRPAGPQGPGGPRPQGGPGMPGRPPMGPRPQGPGGPMGPGGPRPQGGPGGPGAPVRPGMPGRPGMAPGGAPMRPGMPPRPAGPGGPRPMGPGGPRPMGPGQRPGGPMGQGPRPAGPMGPGGPRPQGGPGMPGRPPMGPRPQGPGGPGQPPRPRPEGGPQAARPAGDRPGARPPQQGGPRPDGRPPRGADQARRPKPGMPPRGGKMAAIDPDVAKERAAKEKASAERAGKIQKEHVRQEKRLPKERQLHNKPVKKEETKGTLPAKKRMVTIAESVTVQDLAQKLGKTAAELIKKLIMLGVMATINQEIDADTASVVAGEFGYEVIVKKEDLEETVLAYEEDIAENLVNRPCVVTVMGHVDHGKTSLLDAIRETNVISTEAGGITQHIGAYQVEHNGKKITFLDTPGHEAFTAMRARGAEATDIVVLVVAADDGVMPQTIEAINHSKAAKVPIIVAINKMDKAGANPDRVKQELTEHGLVAEEWGGDTICVPVSAKKREGLEDVLEMILLVSEVAELKANPNRKAKGVVVEAELDKGRGPVATVLVQNGTMRIGDAIIAGTASGKVRAMIDDKGRRVKKAGPSMPVEVLGLSEVPKAGDGFQALDDEKLARQVVTQRINKKREAELKARGRVSLDDLFKQIQEGEVKELNIIIKADVQGSIEALRQSLEKLSTSEVRVNPIHGGVGAITETDIMLASASNAIIIGFNVRPDANARRAAEAESVDIRLYRVIYNAIEDVKAAMVGLLEPEYKEVVIGRVEVRTVFKASKIGSIAGCYVTEGKITKQAEVRVIRDGIVVHEGKLESLKRFKDDVKEVLQGFECGVLVERFNDVREGDTIEAFVMEEVAREL